MKVKQLLQQNMFWKTELEDQLYVLYQFKFLVETIEKLERKSQEMTAQVELLDDVKDKRMSMTNKRYSEKLKNSLAKNPDLLEFIGNKDLGFRIKTTFAPLTSVEAERSFSMYKAMLSDNRLRLEEKAIEHLLVIRYNSALMN